MEIIRDVFADTGIDCLKMLPFLFVAFVLIEGMEQYSGEFTEKLLLKVGKAGPAVGALLGCIPQCGFSVMAANLYADGIISAGTLLSVFLATSDEAILIMLGDPDAVSEIAALLAVKFVVAAGAGYLADLFPAGWIASPKKRGRLRGKLGDHGEGRGILRAAWSHAATIFVSLFLFTGVLNLCVQVFGTEELSAFLLGNTVFQSTAAAVVGMIPNCAASVILAQLYLGGAISFAAVSAGLCAGAGVGLVVLWRVNQGKRENLKITGLLFTAAAAAGMFLEVFQ